MIDTVAMGNSRHNPGFEISILETKTPSLVEGAYDSMLSFAIIICILFNIL